MIATHRIWSKTAEIRAVVIAAVSWRLARSRNLAVSQNYEALERAEECLCRAVSELFE